MAINPNSCALRRGSQAVHWQRRRYEFLNRSATAQTGMISSTQYFRDDGLDLGSMKLPDLLHDCPFFGRQSLRVWLEVRILG